jgi:hypothetical protein
MIHHGDLFTVLPTLEADSIDACVTDPPYELGFMGKHWDASGVAYNVETWRQVLRVLKPGGYLLAFGGTRTYHRMACAIEDAGFEIRDSLQWLYGSGFPKSLDVSKAMDAAAGAERPVVGFSKQQQQQRTPAISTNAYGDYKGQSGDVTGPATDLAKQWQGWGTALKPACEPICMARKPLRGTVAANVARYGTGAINVDACRIGADAIQTSGDLSAFDRRRFEHGTRPTDYATQVEPTTHLGRWPANVLLDEAAAAMLDEQTGILQAPTSNGGGTHFAPSGSRFNPQRQLREPDSGGASRFYYVAKPSREERDYGLDQLPQHTAAELTGRKPGSAGLQNPRAGIRAGSMDRDIAARVARNVHPTVKPVELMRWLVKLVTPLDGLVLDPFTGSGTTGMACRYESRRFIGIEREAEYHQIAEARIAAVAPLFGEASA